MSLILRRSPGQIVVIGETGEIVITVLRIIDNVVHFGIKAPKSISVDRLERLIKIQEEQAKECAAADGTYISLS